MPARRDAARARAALALCALASASAFNLESRRPWLQPNATIPQRVAALLPELTLTDKLWQLQRDGGTPETGVGLMESRSIVAGAGRPSDVARAYNAAVRAYLAAGPGARVGLPPAWRTLATHGGEAFGTVFPQGPALAASWDADAVAATAAAAAAEARALGISLTTFVINLWADARFGRQEEGFSEEPALTAALAAACVAGASGGAPAPDAYVLPPAAPALFKHVGAYGAAAGGLNGGRADVPELTVLDVYLKPWRRAAAAGARGVMPSHNTVLGVPAHASPWLLTQQLRGVYGMGGFFLSDTGDVAALRDYRLCSDDASCAALALRAGVDVEQPPGATYLSLGDAVARGLVNASAIDAAVARVLTHKFSAGLFDAPFVDEAAADAVVNSPAHQALAAATAEAGCVLLKNERGALPLLPGSPPPPSPLRVAVIGPLGGCGDAGSGASGGPGAPLCAAQAALLGNYDGLGPPPLTGVPTVAEALAAVGGARVAVSFARGANVDDGNTSLVPAAAAAAAAADAVVLVLGDDTASSAEGSDRDDLDLPGGQLALLAAVTAARRGGAPLVVVLVNGRTATFGAADGNALLDAVDALLVAWRPGQAGGSAVARLLLGDAAPSGRLPNSWVRAVGQAGGSASPWLQQRVSLFGEARTGAEGRGYAGYWHAANPPTPLFAFGEGLGYTTFAAGNVTAALAGAPAAPLLVAVDVRNTGGRAGTTVVQVYGQDPVGGADALVVRPWKRLLGWARVADLAPGEVRRVSVAVLADDLAYYGDDAALRVHAGNYTVSAGLSSVADGGPGQVVVVDVPAEASEPLTRALHAAQRRSV